MPSVLQQPNAYPLWLLQERQDLGEALLSLNYLPSAGRLNVDVIKVKQLLQTDMVGGSGESTSRHPRVCLLKSRSTLGQFPTTDRL